MGGFALFGYITFNYKKTKLFFILSFKFTYAAKIIVFHGDANPIGDSKYHG
jgi:hypothetical protein